uniref:Uncharacterized protein n=1 Tax=Oryza punctata TaxID=4537 RepID=A0A0E0MLD2_ORYPU
MFVPDLSPPAPLDGNPYPIYDYDPRNHCPPPPSTAPLSGDPRSYGIYADHWTPPPPPPPPPSTAPHLVVDPRFSPSLTPTPSPIPMPTGLSAWQLPVHGRASSSADVSSAPVLTSQLNLWADPASSTSHRKRSVSPQLRPRFRADASSARYSSPHRDQYRDHRHHAGHESGRSSHRFRSPHRASRPLQLEHASQGSSSRGCRRMYDCEDERVGGRDQYLAERRTAERSPASKRLSPSPYDHCKSPPDSPVKLDASYEVNVMNSNGNLDPSSYESLVSDFMDAVERNWHETYDSDDDPAECEKKYQEQIIRFAELALKRYNKSKNNKVKYSLVEAVGGNTIFEELKYMSM